MIPLSISFLKSQQTVGELRKVVKEAQSPIKLQLDTARGDKSFARMQSKTAQARLNKGFTPLSNFKEANTSFTFESPLDRSLKRTTFNYSKLNETRRNLEWQQAEKELGLIQL
jgi:hypothetical protein